MNSVPVFTIFVAFIRVTDPVSVSILVEFDGGVFASELQLSILLSCLIPLCGKRCHILLNGRIHTLDELRRYGKLSVYSVAVFVE